MSDRLKPIHPSVGHIVRELIQQDIGEPVDIILIAFPAVRTGNPQPQFVSSYEPERMEKIIRQIGEQLTPEFAASREIDGVSKDRLRSN